MSYKNFLTISRLVQELLRQQTLQRDTTRVNRYTAGWQLRHTTLPDNKLSQKRSNFAGEMYSTICVEWASAGLIYFGINRSTFDEDMCAKKQLRHFRSR